MDWRFISKLESTHAILPATKPSLAFPLFRGWRSNSETWPCTRPSVAQSLIICSLTWYNAPEYFLCCALHGRESSALNEDLAPLLKRSIIPERSYHTWIPLMLWKWAIFYRVNAGCPQNTYDQHLIQAHRTWEVFLNLASSNMQLQKWPTQFKTSLYTVSLFFLLWYNFVSQIILKTAWRQRTWLWYILNIAHIVLTTWYVLLNTCWPINRTLNPYCVGQGREWENTGSTKSTRNEKHGYVDWSGTKTKLHWYLIFFLTI